MYFSYTYTFYILYLSSCVHTCTSVSVHTINIVQICKTFHDATMQHGNFCYLDSFGALKTLTFLSFVNKLWVKSSFAQVCHDMRRNPDEISCRMKLNSDVPNQGLEVDHGSGVSIGAGYSPLIAFHRNEHLYITPLCVRNSLITLSMASFVFRFHSVLLECKGQWPRVAWPLCFWLVTSGATLCGWNHVNHHLAVWRIHHPSITFRWHYPCGVCHHVWSRPAIPEDLCWCWQSDRGHKRGRQWLRGTHIDISNSVAFDLFEFLYFSDRLNVTLKSSASLKVAMIVSGRHLESNFCFQNIPTKIQLHEAPKDEAVILHLNITEKTDQQLGDVFFFFPQTIVEWRDFFVQDTGTIWDLNVSPFFLDMLVICSMWSVFGHGWTQWPFSQFAIETHLFCCAFCKNHSPVGCEATDLHMSSLHRAGCFALALGRCHLPQGCWPGGWVSRSWKGTLSHFICLRLPVESTDTSAAHRTVAR